MKYLTFAVLALVSLTAAAVTPKGWSIAGSAPKEYEFGVDDAARDAGRKTAYIKAKPDVSPTGFGTLMQTVSADDYRGGRWKLSARMRTKGAAKAQMWMRVDGPGRKLSAFDNMSDRPVTGDSAWKRYEIVLDVPSDSVAVAFGFFLSGTGQVWADDFRIERVASETPLTGRGSGVRPPLAPTNLDFEE